MTQDIIYSSVIESVTDDGIIFGLVSNTLSIMLREMLSELQGLNI
jgi:hypothetical protein